MKIIYLEWIDASSKDMWLESEEVKDWLKDKAHIIKTIGFLEEENKDSVIVSQNIALTESRSMLMKIYKKSIIKRMFLKN